MTTTEAAHPSRAETMEAITDATVNLDAVPKPNTEKEEQSAMQQTIDIDQPLKEPELKSQRSLVHRFRFEVTVLMLATMMLATCVLQTMATSTHAIVRFITLLCALFLSFFGYEWIVYFSNGLTRRKRAYFDAKNVLETYQPRRGTDEARAFKPDPPTPDVGVSMKPTFDSDSTTHKGDETKSADEEKKKREKFLAWRHKYYENEYSNAMKVAEGAQHEKHM